MTRKLYQSALKLHRQRRPSFSAADSRALIALPFLITICKSFRNILQKPLASLIILHLMNVISEITQENKSHLECWCYEQHLVANESCNDRKLDRFDLSQHAHDLLLSGIVERDGARPALPTSLCRFSILKTIMGIVCRLFGRRGGYLLVDDRAWQRLTKRAEAVSFVWDSQVGKVVFGMNVKQMPGGNEKTPKRSSACYGKNLWLADRSEAIS